MLKEHNARSDRRKKVAEKVAQPIDGSRIASQSSDDESVKIDQSPYLPKVGKNEVESALMTLTA